MQKQRYILITLFLIFSVAAPLAFAQNVEYFKVPDLEKILNSREDKLFVVNFWATWCPPCVSELPAFEKVAGGYDKAKVRFILISLDFPSQIEKQLIPFLKKNKISLEVAVMMETDSNLWIDKVDPSWQGNIPSTLFLNNPKKIRHFHPEALDEKGLRNLVDKYLL
jgi:thiol-disulfide isomerase/thioredoxin